MTQRTHELLQKALALTEEERAELAGCLMESLESPADADTESAWQNEIARRLADLESGKAKTVSWAQVKNRLASQLENDCKNG